MFNERVSFFYVFYVVEFFSDRSGRDDFDFGNCVIIFDYSLYYGFI